MNKSYSKAAASTFALNKGEPLHRWYAYLEGYSSCLIEDLILEIGPEKINHIYDPFCGTGTTALVASKYGIQSYYSETNPFMRMVIDAKINCVKRLRELDNGSFHLKNLLQTVESYVYLPSETAPTWDGFEKYFEADVLAQLQDLLNIVNAVPDIDSRTIALVLLASVIVRASKMTRQGDLRFAKESEKSKADKDIVANFITKIKEALDDIENNECPTQAATQCLSPDSREISVENLIDCVITSPPYLNGTNYIRNTKLELKLSGFLTSEKDLPSFHSKGIVAGINNVSKRNPSYEPLECVKPFLEKLIPVSYDKRIPTMVVGYFHDMAQVIERLSIAMTDNGIFIMDIGDSQFAGIHIPTHEILTQICADYGFELYQEDILRQRRSKNGMILSQRLLKFKLHKRPKKSHDFALKAQSFVENMPYRCSPYSGRNWGHSWHSLCSYHGKLKPSIAHFLIKQFTKPGDIVVDPLCGVGTIPLEACLQGRIGIGNDLSELAYVVTKAKLEKPTLEDSLVVLDELKQYIEKYKDSAMINRDIEKYANFGYNGKVSTYFHPDTYKEILCARRFFIEKYTTLTSAESMVYACLLHVLHGNRPYALSRTSHPLTPYAPKGEFVYKNLIEHVLNKLTISYSKVDFDTFVNGHTIWGDYCKLPNHRIQADIIVCSPPFADSIRFYMQNWMRLWLCGWESEDYKQAETAFLDQKQKKDFDVYLSFFETCASILKPDGRIILHLGKTDRIDMAEELAVRAAPWFVEIYRGCENVQSIEKHGIKDKGSTVAHQFLFLQKK